MKDNGEARPGEIPSVPRYWLITKHENSRIRILTIDLGGEEALPVFSFEEEAAMFLSLWVPRTGWWIKKTTAGELISVLYGPCAGIRKVVLDPPVVGDEATVDLLCLSRRRFVGNLAGEHKPLSRAKSRGQGQHSSRTKGTV